MDGQSVSSPCVKICRLNAYDVCVGCGRTLAEISTWLSMSERERRRVWEELPARLAVIDQELGRDRSRAAGPPK